MKHRRNIAQALDTKGILFHRFYAQMFILAGSLEHEFYFSIYWEESSQLTNIFQRGWNHQPDMIFQFCVENNFILTRAILQL